MAFSPEVLVGCKVLVDCKVLVGGKTNSQSAHRIFWIHCPHQVHPVEHDANIELVEHIAFSLMATRIPFRTHSKQHKPWVAQRLGIKKTDHQCKRDNPQRTHDKKAFTFV